MENPSQVRRCPTRPTKASAYGLEQFTRTNLSMQLHNLSVFVYLYNLFGDKLIGLRSMLLVVSFLSFCVCGWFWIVAYARVLNNQGLGFVKKEVVETIIQGNHEIQLYYHCTYKGRKHVGAESNLCNNAYHYSVQQLVACTALMRGWRKMYNIYFH